MFSASDLPSGFPTGEGLWSIFETTIVLAVIFLVINFLLVILRKRLLRSARTRRQKSNIELLTSSIRYLVLFFFIIGALYWNFGSLKDFGFALGIISVGLGFALQRPITSFVAWIMIMVKRPFEIGDRVMIGTMRGNVADITIGHIYLDEVGRYGGEEISGRTVILPNAFLFEKEIINYSYRDDHILGQVSFTITFESNLQKAVKIALEAGEKYAGEYNKVVKKDGHYRINFSPNGIEIHVRYYVPFPLAQETATRVTEEIFANILKAKEIEISYPHTKVLLPDEMTKK